MRTRIWAALAVFAAAALVYLFFMPVFAGRMTLSQGLYVAGFGVRWYGLALALALLAGYGVARANSWRYGLAKDEADRFAFWLVVVALLGARLYFVAFEWEYYAQDLSRVIEVWNGGLSIFGGILSGLGFMWLYSRRKVYGFWQLADLVALGFPLGQAIGRLGNFFNYEAYGAPTGLPWKMFVPEAFRLADAAYYHPTFLYEALGNLLIFALLLKLRGTGRPGTLALAYLAAYGLLRFAVEGIRMDSVFLGAFRADQLVAAAVFLAAASGLVYRHFTQPKT